MLDYQLLNHSLIVAVLLFALGLVGFVARRNLVTMLLSSAISLQGVVLALSAFSTFHANAAGALFAIVVVIALVAEAAIGMALSIALLRDERSLDVSRWNSLGEGRAEENRPVLAEVLNSAERYAVAKDAAAPGAMPVSDGNGGGAGH